MTQELTRINAVLALLSRIRTDYAFHHGKWPRLEGLATMPYWYGLRNDAACANRDYLVEFRDGVPHFDGVPVRIVRVPERKAEELCLRIVGEMPLMEP